MRPLWVREGMLGRLHQFLTSVCLGVYGPDLCPLLLLTVCLCPCLCLSVSFPPFLSSSLPTGPTSSAA